MHGRFEQNPSPIKALDGEGEYAIDGISSTTVQTANNWYPSRLLDFNTIVTGDYLLDLNIPPLWHHLNKKEQPVVVSQERWDFVNTIMIRERAQTRKTLMERAVIELTTDGKTRRAISSGWFDSCTFSEGQNVGVEWSGTKSLLLIIPRLVVFISFAFPF